MYQDCLSPELPVLPLLTLRSGKEDQEINNQNVIIIHEYIKM